MAKAILHMLSTLKHMSPFDVNMALDAGYDAAIPYTNVTLDEVTALVQDAMFSRAPSAAHASGQSAPRTRRMKPSTLRSAASASGSTGMDGTTEIMTARGPAWKSSRSQEGRMLGTTDASQEG